MALVHGGRYSIGLPEWGRRRPVRWVIDRLQAWRRAVAGRRYLATLDDHGLRDLGLSRADVDQDASFRDRFR